MLLPADLPPRHADTLQVVMSALLAAHAGAGYRSIAADLGVPPDIVRSWLRRARARAEWLRLQGTQWATRLDPSQHPIQPAGSRLGDALSAPGHAVIATRLWMGASAATAWQMIGMITRGRLLTPRWFPSTA